MSISVGTKKVYETEDGSQFDSWHDASRHLMFNAFAEWASSRFTSFGNSQEEILDALCADWPSLNLTMEAHNARLTSGEPQ